MSSYSLTYISNMCMHSYILLSPTQDELHVVSLFFCSLSCRGLSHSTVSSQPKRPYSPLHLTETDIQDIWLKLLGCFTAAAYTGTCRTHNTSVLIKCCDVHELIKKPA